MTHKYGVRLFVLAIPFVLSACNSANFALSDDERRGPAAPLGTQRIKSVDGLTVGDRLMEAGEFELALQSYRRSAGEDGISADSLSAIGSANLRLGRLNQARVFLEKAIEIDGNSASAWNNLGVVLMNLQEARQAREAFRVAFGIDNGNSELIRQNLILANDLIVEQSAKIADSAALSDFSLVRHGNGSYFLLGN